MKLPERLKSLDPQTRWMIVVIVLLLTMIATRWSYISQTAGTAFRERFAPPDAQHDAPAEHDAPETKP